MLSRLIVTVFFAMFSAGAFSQSHMKFMGVPIDGNVREFCKKMESLGLKRDAEDVQNAVSYSGRFFGEEANIQVGYDPETMGVYQVSVFIVRENVLAASLYSIQRNYLKAVEEKYRFTKEEINPALYQYDYIILGENNPLEPVGMIQTFIVDSKTIPSPSNSAMLSITYSDVTNLLKYEERKSNDI